MNRWHIAGPAALLLIVTPLRVHAQDVRGPGSLPPLLTEAEEIALAESAAPTHIAQDAGIYVLRRGGYLPIRPSRNGFTCLVERSHPTSLEPICFDAEGGRTIVPRILEVAALREHGADSATVADAVAEGFRSGRYRVPERAGVAFMLSPATRFFNPQTGQVETGHPHLMFYSPHLRNADIGSMGEHAASGPDTPFVIEEGSPGAYIVVLVGAPAAPGAERPFPRAETEELR